MLISSILFLLSSNAVTSRRDKSILYARAAITSLIFCFIISINSYSDKFFEKSLGLFGGFYQATAITQSFHTFVILITMIIMLLNSFYPRWSWINNSNTEYDQTKSVIGKYSGFILSKMSEQFKIIEYPLIILFILLGGLFLMSSSDLIAVFLSIELQSYGLYILCAVYRNSEQATSAALTYFLLGALSSCFILLASALLYANSGNTNFDAVYVIYNIANLKDNVEQQNFLNMNIFYGSDYINYSLAIMSIGFLFKVSAAPFHFWSPDVYDAIPTIVTTFVAIFAKLSIFILLLELVHYTNNQLIGTQQISGIDYLVEKENNSLFNLSWTFTLLVSSLLSLLIGAILGLTQFRIKRLYAYSTINHLGFILLALTINSIESIQSFIFYLMQYSLTNLNAFLLLLTIGYSLFIYVEKNTDKKHMDLMSNLKDINNSPIQLISQMKGYFYINPVLALSLAITVFSFVGIPPLAGFFAKQMVLSSALDNGYIFMSLIAILVSVISAYYYLALVKQIFFHKTDYELTPVLNNMILYNIVVKNTVFNFSNPSKTYYMLVPVWNYLQRLYPWYYSVLRNVNLYKSDYLFISFFKDILKPQLNKFKEIFSTNMNVYYILLTSSLTITISILTLIILLFIFIPQEWLSLANILALILFYR